VYLSWLYGLPVFGAWFGAWFQAWFGALIRLWRADEKKKEKI